MRLGQQTRATFSLQQLHIPEMTLNHTCFSPFFNEEITTGAINKQVNITVCICYRLYAMYSELYTWDKTSFQGI